MLSRSEAAPIYRVALIGVAVLFLWLTIRVDLIIFAGILLAIALDHTAQCAGRRLGLRHALALTLVVVLILCAVAAIGWLFASTLTQQFSELSDRLSGAITTLTVGLRKSPVGQMILHQLQPNELFSQQGVFGSFFGFASNVVELIAGVVVIIFIGLYGAAEPGLYVAGAIRLVPPPRRPRAAQILAETGDALWYWLLGRLLSMTVLGCLSTFGLWALGVPAPIALGLLAGILTFVPYIGAWVSAVPAMLLGAALHLMLGVYVAFLYLLIHLVEGYLLVPLVQRRTAHLPPALSLATQVVLGTLVGLLGFLLATPALAALLVLVRGIYVEDALGDRGTTAGR